MGANCAASVSIGCLFCCQGCNAEKLRNAFTFLPPQSSYMVEEETDSSDGSRKGSFQYVSDVLKKFAFYQQAARNADVHVLRTSRGERIPIVWVRNKEVNSAPSMAPGSGRKSRLVILHCHGNATDIGVMMGPYFEMCKQLGCEVVGVEYSGYGASTGLPSSSNTLADVEAAYNFVVSQGVPAERIVVYGQSVGSGPALGLASRKLVGGLVLHSPLLSGIKVIDPQPNKCCKPSCVYSCFDFFHNDRAMKSVTCPAFVIHGCADEIIPLYHGVRLAQAAPGHCRWPGYFPPEAGHNDIVETNATEYFMQLAAFMRNVRERADGVSTEPPCCGIGKPAQIEMGDMSLNQDREEMRYIEPVVGPEDGRYEQLRRGYGGGAAKASGSARELQSVPPIAGAQEPAPWLGSRS
mmetsp:Transcript_42223/g.106357  ORF Transcript_42223/g.106357 Transcript_42223/m.106357 type:complete len:408 (-) Transcript_42223:65-1288(-)